MVLDEGAGSRVDAKNARAVDVPTIPRFEVRAKRAEPFVRSGTEEAMLRRIQGVLTSLARQPGVLGALLARRDGLHVASNWHEPIDVEEFSASHAAALNAAQRALGQRRGAEGLMLDEGDQRLLTRAVGRDLVVVAAVKPQTDWEAAFLLMEAAGMDLED